MDTIRRDIRFALRALHRKPGFSIVATLTLALGVGATTAAFSLVHAVILRSLPFPAAERLVSIAGGSLSRDDLAEWRAAMPALDRMEAFTLGRAVLTGHGPAVQLRTMPVSAGFLDLLGARARQGRLLAATEYEPGAPPVAVISHRLWSTWLEADPAAIGRVINLDGVAYTVAGVLERDFDPIRFRDIDVWMPIVRSTRPGAAAVGRLAVGATLPLLRDQASGLAARLTPSRNQSDLRINVQPLSEVYSSELRRPLGIAFAAAAMVLLIACANVAGLLFARAAERVSELAVRSALGASRLDLVRQLLVESFLLAAAAVGCGIVLAWWAVDALPRIAPPWGPRLDQVGLDPTVVLFAVVLAGFTTIVAGFAPALGSARAAARVASSAQRSTPTRSVRRLREALIVAEIALSLVLLIGSTLLVRTFLILRPAAPGFRTEDRITARLDLPGADFVDAHRVPLMRSILDALRALPGKPDVAAVTDLPLTGVTMLFAVSARDDEPVAAAGGRPIELHFRSATPGYFDVLELRPVSGRLIAESDGPQQTPVIVLNENAVRRLWPDEPNPIGHTVTFADVAPGVPFTVVGILADTRVFGGTTRGSAEAFVSWWQVPVGRMQFVLHDRGHAINETMLREAVAAIEPDLPLGEVSYFDRIADQSVAMPRFQMILMVLSAALALILALVGCYATQAYHVARRLREFGVRVALGATPRDLLRDVLRRAMLVVAAGIVLGLLAAAASTRVLAAMLFGVAPLDPLTFAVTAAVLAGAGAIAALVPARRAASVEPVIALRAD